jgi:dTDP-4-amino-4,6-dideoxygalactose transaminase
MINGKPAGSFGALAIFSIGSTKYLTGGSGGVLVTDDDTLAARVAELLDFDSSETKAAWKNGQPVALPGRLSDLNAAMALVQFDRLEEFAARRRTIATLYSAALAKLPHFQIPPSSEGHSYYRYVVRTTAPSAPLTAALRERGIDARTSVNPWLDAPRFSGTSFVAGAFPSADRWRGHLLSLPIYPGLTDEDAQCIVRNLQELTDHA